MALILLALRRLGSKIFGNVVIILLKLLEFGVNQLLTVWPLCSGFAYLEFFLRMCFATTGSFWHLLCASVVAWPMKPFCTACVTVLKREVFGAALVFVRTLSSWIKTLVLGLLAS